MKAELIVGMTDETYHADPVPGGSLSSTFVRLLTNHVPAKAKARFENRKPTKSMNLGKAAHRHALGVGPDLIVWQYDGRSKDGKAEREEWAAAIASEAAVAVTEGERDQIYGMVEALRANTEVRQILDANPNEVSGFWQEGSTWCRARYDLLIDSDAGGFDYKTCQDATRRGFSKAMASYGYHQQAEFYQRGLQALGHRAGSTPLRFILQETEAPYLVQIHTPDEMALETARLLNDRAIGIYTEAKKTGVWPGFPSLHAEPTSLPGYYFFDHEDVLPDAWNATGEELVIA